MQGLSLYNTKSRQEETFIPLDPLHIRLYACGPTVYDFAHLGNARPAVVTDILVRLLRRLYPKVTYVRNITDIDDKINARSRETGESIAVITAKTTAEYHQDMQSLHVLPPDEEPRATGHIAEMITLIQKLIENGHAYEAEGHVLFAVKAFAPYGALSGRSQDELLAGARVEVAPFKRDPGDFVLWKPSSADLPGWESPWGRGRPGWHIECSAMSMRYLGKDFDIHAGGSDLIFPHHENEIAQSCAAFPGHLYAKYWVHNGMLRVNGEKMSKSLGNFFTIREILQKAPGEAVRFLLLRTHYRKTLDFNDETLAEAKATLDKFYRAVALHGLQQEAYQKAGDREALSRSELDGRIEKALCQDLNTPQVGVILHSLADEALAGSAGAAALLQSSARFLGLLEHSAEAWFHGQADQPGESATDDKAETAEIEALLAAREAARKARDFAKADALRHSLAEKGILIEDTPAGTIWRRR